MAGFFDELADYADSGSSDATKAENQNPLKVRQEPSGSYADDLLGNIGPSALNASQQAYEYATHPIETVQSVGHAIVHPIDTAQGIYHHYADRYGSMPKFTESLRQDPAGTVLDFMPAAGAASAPIKAAGSMARSGAGAAVEGARGLSSRLAGTMDELAAAREAKRAPQRYAGDRELGPVSTEAPEGAPAPSAPSASAAPAAPEGSWENISLNRPDRLREWREPTFPPMSADPRGGKIQALLHQLRVEGTPPNRFQSNALNNYIERAQREMRERLEAQYPQSRGEAPAPVRAEAPAPPPEWMEGIHDPTNAVNFAKAYLTSNALRGMRAGEIESGRKALANQRAANAARTDRHGRVSLGMTEGAGYKPEFASSINPESTARGGLSDALNRIISRAPTDPAAWGAVNALYSPTSQKHILPDMDILKHKPSTGPTVEEGPVTAKTETEKPKPTATVSRPAPHRAAPRPTPHKAAPHRAAPHRAAPRRTAPSEMYYGDYRDVDPFTNDPIGSAIDELTGNTAKTSKRKGTLGDLGFANGGMARKHYEEGGAEERVPVLSDIGDALGGLFGGGDQQRVVAQDKQAAPSDDSASNFFERWQSNPLSQFLFSAGLGTMASDRVNPLQAIGEGGLRGLEYMQAAQANQRVLREEQRARAAELADQKILEKIFSGGDETTAPETTVPAKKTAAATPEVPETPVIAPAKVTEAAPPAAAGAPSAAPEAKPEVVPAVVKEPAAPAAEEPIVAKDDRLDSLTAQYNKIQKVLPFVKTPATLQKLRIAESGLKAQIDQIRQDRKDAAAAKKEAARDKIAQQNLELSKQRADEYLHPEKGAFARKSAEELAKDFGETQKAAPTLPGQIKQIEGIIDAVEHGKVYHSEQALKAAKFFQGLGLDMPIERLGSVISWLGSDPEKIANTQNLARLGVKDLLQQIGGSLGQGISEGDRRTIMEAALGVDKDPASNLHALRVLKQAMSYQAKRAIWQQEYVGKVGYLDAGYSAYEAQKAKENPIFGEESKTGQTSSAPKTMSREEKIAELRRRQQGQQ